MDDSIVMPDPLPSATTSIASIVGSRTSARVGPSSDSAMSATSSANDSFAAGEETPLRSSFRIGGSLRLHPTRGIKDDMEVFSPLVDVQPITPSFDKLFEGTKNDFNKKSALLFSSSRKPLVGIDEGSNRPLNFDWKPTSTSVQVCQLNTPICNVF